MVSTPGISFEWEDVWTIEWGMKHAKPLLDANPELQLHHMHDPNQDRLTSQAWPIFA